MRTYLVCFQDLRLAGGAFTGRAAALSICRVRTMTGSLSSRVGKQDNRKPANRSCISGSHTRLSIANTEPKPSIRKPTRVYVWLDEDSRFVWYRGMMGTVHLILGKESLGCRVVRRQITGTGSMICQQLFAVSPQDVGVALCHRESRVFCRLARLATHYCSALDRYGSDDDFSSAKHFFFPTRRALCFSVSLAVNQQPAIGDCSMSFLISITLLQPDMNAHFKRRLFCEKIPRFYHLVPGGMMGYLPKQASPKHIDLRNTWTP
ncbi:hypothetical protein F4678DRAFT_379511 [Xylaria arbuscula]|nr:hypothetical protein F4678DRAFT_379511 [Xylaria arbuscula]